MPCLRLPLKIVEYESSMNMVPLSKLSVARPSTPARQLNSQLVENLKVISLIPVRVWLVQTVGSPAVVRPSSSPSPNPE